jgi:hypothetical protein
MEVNRDVAGTTITFIVRISRDQEGGLGGVVERVKTGEKRRVHRIEDLGPLIVQMLEREEEP